MTFWSYCEDPIRARIRYARICPPARSLRGTRIQGYRLAYGKLICARIRLPALHTPACPHPFAISYGATSDGAARIALRELIEETRLGVDP